MEHKPTDKKVNRLEVYIDASTKKIAKAKAKAEGKSLSQIVSTALNQFIEKK
jgi:predicted HicB family RNase H-like nuclease